jgi:hypothetical protein
VWSERDPATGRFQLMTRTSGAATKVPVRTRKGPFDVDLGPGPAGSTVVVYSRGGEIFRYDFGSGDERTLGAFGHLPSIWKNRISWVQRGKLYVSVGENQPRPHRVRGGRGKFVGVDMRGRTIAFVRVRPHGEGHEFEMLLARGRGAARVVDRAASGLLSIVEMMRPSFEGRGLYYAVARKFASGQRFLRFDLRTHRLREVVSHPRILSAAFDGGRFFYVQTPSEGDSDDDACVDDDLQPAPCELKLSDAVF